MLPPVRAASSTFNDFQSAAPQAAASRPRVDVANSASRPQAAALPVSGSRLDILSLSGQLQLSQSFSIFAETVGKLLKVERHEGEALPDYSKRVLEAVKALNPNERAVLERTLNQLVKGISLKLLAEILKNPIGPDAARLAMRMETAQLLDRDPVTRAVVSSYRQNGGSEPSFNSPLPPRPAAAATPLASTPTTATPPAPVQTTAAISTGAPPAPVPPNSLSLETTAQTATTSAAIEASDIQQPGLASQAANQNTSHNTQAAEKALLSTKNVPEGVTVAEPEQAAKATGVTETAAASAQTEAEQGEHLAKVARASELAARQPPTAARPTPAPVFYDAPALARLGQKPAEIDNTPRHQRPVVSDRAMLAAMSEWLVEVLAAEGQIEGEAPHFYPALPQQAASSMEETEATALRQLMTQTGDDEAANPLQKAAALTEDSAGGPVLRPENATTVRAALPAEPDAIAANTLAAQAQQGVQRDGVPLPYVPYEPTAELLEDEKPEFKRHREEGDSEQQASGDDDFSQDQGGDAEGDEDAQLAAGEEPNSQDLLDQPDDDNEERGVANDLYWRMADIS